jgi:hypothetical protein
MRTILLIMLGLSSLLNADLTRANNIVTDSDTSLEWLDDEALSKKPWKEAIDYCEAKDIDSKDDWRLANVNELSILLDSNSLDSIFTNGFASKNYWSSTSHATNTFNAWFVVFSNGSQYSSYKLNNVYVRCVRAGQ